MNGNLEKLFFAYLWANPPYVEAVPAEYFSINEIKFVYDILKKYYVDNPSCNPPTPRQLAQMILAKDPAEETITKTNIQHLLTVNLDE